MGEKPDQIERHIHINAANWKTTSANWRKKLRALIGDATHERPGIMLERRSWVARFRRYCQAPRA
jgi:hypothetical protein